MASATNALPTEILYQVFQNVQNHYQRFTGEEIDPSTPFRPDEVPFFSAPFMPWLCDERRQFAHLRLVSRTWKVVADTFMFRDIVYSINELESRSDDYGHRFLANVISMGYTHLVRSIHLQLQLRDDIGYLDYSPDDNAILFENIDLLCYLLVQRSGPRRRLFIQMLSPLQIHNDDRKNGISNRVMDALQKLPRHCEVEFSFCSWISKKEDLTTITPLLMSMNLCSLELRLTELTSFSSTFFASLRCTKKLVLSFENDRSRIENLYVKIAADIALMPSLEDLCVYGILPRVRKDLRRLCIQSPFNYFPEPDFFVCVSKVNALEELRLSFRAMTLHQSTFSVTELSEITQAQLASLRVLQICTTKRASHLLTLFCSTLLRICSSLQELKLYGLGLTDEIILGASSSSLRKVSLYSDTATIFTADEVHAGLAKPTEQIQWSTLCTLFQRNQDLSEVRLDIDLRLPPLTYNDIENLSNSCPRLDYIELYTNIMNDDVHYMLLRDANFAYKWDTLCSPGSPAENKVVKRALAYVCDDTSDDEKFTLDLKMFRRLKDGDVKGVSGSERGKKARKRRGRR
jgi:hypothetical protein